MILVFTFTVPALLLAEKSVCSLLPLVAVNSAPTLLLFVVACPLVLGYVCILLYLTTLYSINLSTANTNSTCSPPITNLSILPQDLYEPSRLSTLLQRLCKVDVLPAPKRLDNCTKPTTTPPCRPKRFPNYPLLLWLTRSHTLQTAPRLSFLSYPLPKLPLKRKTLRT
jgi:hypothetical protein